MNSYYVLDAGNSTVEKTDMISTIRVPNVNDFTINKELNSWIPIIKRIIRGQTAEARRTTILQPVEQKPHSQKDRQDEKAEGYIPDEGTR